MRLSNVYLNVKGDFLTLYIYVSKFIFYISHTISPFYNLRCLFYKSLHVTKFSFLLYSNVKFVSHVHNFKFR